MKANKKQLIQHIINEWDPIDLFPMAPENEYEDEIAPICNLLNEKGLSIERIEESIEKIFTKSFGEDVFYSFVSKCECREVAEKLHQIIN